MGKENYNVLNGISLGITLVVISGFLYWQPDFLRYDIVSYVIGTAIGVFGFFGMLTQIGKLDEKFNSAINNIAASGMVGVFLYIIYYFFSNIFVNIFILLISIFVIFGIVSGVLQITFIIVNEHNIKHSSIKIAVFILNVFIFILTTLQILQILEVI